MFQVPVAKQMDARKRLSGLQLHLTAAADWHNIRDIYARYYVCFWEFDHVFFF